MDNEPESTQLTFVDSEGPNLDLDKSRRVARRANDLDGSTWTKHSISIWSNIKKTKEEVDLKHPALFPIELISRLIQCFTTYEEKVVLDPFAGVGSSLLAAQVLGKTGIGIELSKKFADLARERPVTRDLILNGADPNLGQRIIYKDDARNLLKYVNPESVDFVVTSPPYWDILTQRRTADYKEIRNYGNEAEDLGRIDDYKKFLDALKGIFTLVYGVLKEGKYCCVVVMDLRKKADFFPFHADVASFMQEIGFKWDDIIIWDRRHEYNNMRPLGYPSRFRINKAHEFILIFQKPSTV